MIATDRPDLSGGVRFDTSPRHHGYVDAHALTHYRESVFTRMNWDRGEQPPAMGSVRGRTAGAPRKVSR